MKSKRPHQKIVRTVGGMPALYVRTQFSEQDRELWGPWTVTCQTESGYILEHTEPGGYIERHVFRSDQVLTPDQAQEFLDRVAAPDPFRPRPGDYVAVVPDNHNVVRGFVVSVTECFAEVLMDDGSTGPWVEEYRRPKKKKKTTRRVILKNMLVLARGADERAT